jgi:hypothetical protein
MGPKGISKLCPCKCLTIRRGKCNLIIWASYYYALFLGLPGLLFTLPTLCVVIEHCPSCAAVQNQTHVELVRLEWESVGEHSFLIHMTMHQTLGGLRCEAAKQSVNCSFFFNSEVNLEINLYFMTFVISKLDVCQMQNNKKQPLPLWLVPEIAN